MDLKLRNLIFAAIAGLVAGVVATMALMKDTTVDAQGQAVRDIESVTKVTVAEAEQHREDRYESIRSVTDVLALPSQFSQAEALHVLAGRSDSASIQGLIFEASRIADHHDRQRMLGVLFSRLTELDGQSALALARTDSFRNDKRIEQWVWHTLARLDLDEAISLALAQTTRARQKRAAQVLFAAHGYMGNDITDRIAAELGIEPDATVRARYVETLAARSITDAIEFVNGRESSSDRRALVNTLAQAALRQDPDGALSYADLIRDKQLQSTYRTIVLVAQATEDPTRVLDQLVATGADGLDSGQIFAAFKSVVNTDVDLALGYYERLDPGELRDGLAAQLARRLAREDLSRAVAWAREQQSGPYPSTLMAVIREVTKLDPSLALETILAEPDERSQRYMLQTLVQTVARDDPQLALSYLDRLPDEQVRRFVAQSAVNSLIRSDPDAAITWVLAQEEAVSRRLLTESMMLLVATDVHAAMRLLPTLPDEQARHYTIDIAKRLAESGAQSEAMSLIRQHEGKEGYDEMRAAVISGMAARNPVAAKQLADQLSDTEARDLAYANIIQHHAYSDPAEAARWINSISSETRRNQVTQMLIREWAARDASAAMRHVDAMPSGRVRDTAIASMTSRWSDIRPEQQALINSIEDPAIRSQANMNRIYSLIQADPIGAQQLVEQLDLTEEQRRQVETMMEEMQLFR